MPFITLSQTFKEKYTILYKARDVFLAKRIIFPQIESSFLLTPCINDIQLVANESMTAVGTCEKAIDRCSIVSMSIVTSSTLLHTYILCVDANFGVARHVK